MSPFIRPERRIPFIARRLRKCASLGLGILGAMAQLSAPALAALPTQMSVQAVQAGEDPTTHTHSAAVSILSVGAGQCILISCPNGDKILDDCGSGEGTSAQQSVSTFLNSVIGASPLYIAVTHPHVDHYNLISQAIGSHPVERVLLGGQRAAYTNGQFNQWLGALRTQGGTQTPIDQDLAPGTHDAANQPRANFQCSTAAGPDGLYLLTVNAGARTNDLSAVMMFKYGAFQIIMLGDAEKEATTSLITNYQTTTFLQSTVVVPAHHGASTNGANPPTLVRATRPKIVAFSAGSRHGHPTCATTSQYQNSDNNPRLLGRMTTRFHDFRCYVSSRQEPGVAVVSSALFNTKNSGALVIFTDGPDESVWECPDNSIGATCTQKMPR